MESTSGYQIRCPIPVIDRSPLLAQTGHSPDFDECPLSLHKRHSTLPPAVQKLRSKAIFVRVQSAINNRRTKAVIANAGDFAADYRACETVANVVWVTNQRARIGGDE
ncbi:MAG: hypothetical protein H7Z73_02375, partial [Candidatus Saccharibacteria bacterium]|nr:hypothetical protein [Moraxellaceae bacterium]